MELKYTKEFLISEAHRFVKENRRVPHATEMTVKNGYVSYSTCVKYFGSFNNYLIAAGLDVYIPIRKSKKFHLKKRKTCNSCGSVSLRYRKGTKNYLCRNCNNISNKPIIVEKLHCYRNTCIEHPV